MNSTLADAAGERARAAAPPAHRPAGSTLLTLLRREFWEHRALWIAPLVVAALLALLSALGRQASVGMDGRLPGFDGGLTQQNKVALFTIVQWGLSVPLYIVMLLCVSWYLCDCLYAERRDRSILFWKSLPVSDELTVLSKLLTALVAAPLVVFALALAAHLAFFAIFKVRVGMGNLPAVLTWNTYEWFRTEVTMLVMLLISALWYAPIAAALLVLSVATRRPLLWATLVPVVAPIIERVALGTHYLRDFIAYRVLGIWGTLALPHQSVISRHYGLHPVGSLLEDLNFRGAFTDMDLWLGLAAAAALTYAAVRLRRYRDDT
jgi:ABC-2 type transport system permease protein